MKVSFIIIWNMAKENIITSKDNYTLVIGFKIKNMVKGYIFMRMVQDITVSFIIIWNMVKEE